MSAAVSYELRSASGNPVFSYDKEHRAREAMAKAAKNGVTKLQLVRVTKVEEIIA